MIGAGRPESALDVRSAFWNSVRSQVASYVRQHPELWTLGFVAGAWVTLARHELSAGQHRHHAHHQHVMTPAMEAYHWLAMVVAMMLPLMTVHLRHVAFQTYRRRRIPAMLHWLAGYLSIWLLAGLPVVLLRTQSLGHQGLAAAVAFALAGGVSLTRWHQRTLLAHHSTRALAPCGWAALRAEVGEGLRLGGWCVLNCWLWMLACTLTGHALPAMVGCFVIGVLERHSFRPRPSRVAALSLLLAAWSAWSVA